MSITRTAWTDDDGTGTTGTVINNAWKTELYNQIDALLANRVVPSFSAGNFTGSGSMTVTVDAGDVNSYSYQVINKLMTLWFELVTITLGGTPSTEVRIAIPGGFTPAARAWNTYRANDNGTAKTGAALAVNGETFVRCYVDISASANWAASTNNSVLAGEITFPVN